MPPGPSKATKATLAALAPGAAPAEASIAVYCESEATLWQVVL